MALLSHIGLAKWQDLKPVSLSDNRLIMTFFVLWNFTLGTRDHFSLETVKSSSLRGSSGKSDNDSTVRACTLLYQLQKNYLPNHIGTIRYLPDNCVFMRYWPYNNDNIADSKGDKLLQYVHVVPTSCLPFWSAARRELIVVVPFC